MPHPSRSDLTDAAIAFAIASAKKFLRCDFMKPPRCARSAVVHAVRNSLHRCLPSLGIPQFARDQSCIRLAHRERGPCTSAAGLSSSTVSCCILFEVVI